MTSTRLRHRQGAGGVAALHTPKIWRWSQRWKNFTHSTLTADTGTKFRRMLRPSSMTSPSMDQPRSRSEALIWAIHMEYFAGFKIRKHTDHATGLPMSAAFLRLSWISGERSELRT